MKPNLIREQEVGDPQVDTDNFNRLVQAANANSRLFFDPQFFDVRETNGGRFVTLRQAWQEYDHFRIEGWDQTSVIVRGGRWNADGGHADLTVDSGTSNDAEDYKTLTSITADRFIVLTVDDADTPTLLTASADPTYPAAGTAGLKWCIGKATTSASKIVRVEQYWTGDIRGRDQSGGASLVQTWEGQPTRDVTDGGKEWYLDSVTFTAGNWVLDMQQRCLQWSPESGFADYTGTVQFGDGAGGIVDIAVASGVLGSYTGTLVGIDPFSGAEVSVTVTAGVASGYEGAFEGINPTSGAQIKGRIDGGKFKT